MNNCEKSELYRGFIYAYCLAPFLGSNSLLLCLLSGLLYWAGGNVHKSYRRYILPIVITIIALSHYGTWQYALPLLPMIGVFSIGYGIPSFYPGYEDDGSKIGKWVFYGIGGSRDNVEYMGPLATFIVHFILGILFILSNCIYIWHNPFTYLFCLISCAICVGAIAKEY